MNKEELLQKAITDYPIGTAVKCAITGGEGKTSSIPYHDDITDDEVFIDAEAINIGSNYVGIYFRGKWAEIISQPKEARPEPKAGDMVQGLCSDNHWSVESYFNTGGKDRHGYAIVLNSLDNYVTFSAIRLPQKSWVESKVDEMIKESIEGEEECEFLPLEEIKQLMIDICKWGQANPDKK